ncbi:MAG: haloacid dehalogenase [Actinomycetota bacterium]
MDLEQIQLALRANLDEKYQAREQGLTLARKAIRLSANAIRAIHRSDRSDGTQLLDEARLSLDEALAAMTEHPDIRYAGFLHDAMKEYAEARVTYALVFDLDIPSPSEIRVEAAAYLNGLGEAVGEVRRHLLDQMKRGDLTRSEHLLDAIDEIFYLMTSMDYPDGMTGGLRRTTDVTRSIIERTRGDLSNALVQQRLLHALQGQSEPSG